MAKNTGRQGSSGAKKKSQQGSKNKKQTGSSAAKEPGSRNKEVLYQIRTKRDSDIIKAYITFTYRAFHPRVTGRLIFIGILVAAPALIVHQTWLKAACAAVGALLILLGLFRQYISLAITKSQDEAYKNGTEFIYEFTMNDAIFHSGEDTSYISKYKDIIQFFYDEDYFYLGIRNRDFFILPKNKFTIGDPATFEDFIYKRSKMTCKWLPNKFSDRMKLRRAQRTINSGLDRK